MGTHKKCLSKALPMSVITCFHGEIRGKKKPDGIFPLKSILSGAIEQNPDTYFFSFFVKSSNRYLLEAP